MVNLGVNFPIFKEMEKDPKCCECQKSGGFPRFVEKDPASLIRSATIDGGAGVKVADPAENLSYVS